MVNNRFIGLFLLLLWGNGDNYVLMFLDCSNNLLNGSIFEGFFVFVNLEVVRFVGNNFIGFLLVDFFVKLWELDF